MTPRELKSLLLKTIPANATLLIEGPPGCAKTALVKQANDELGRKLVVIHASTIDPVDTSGYPMAFEVNGEKRLVRCLDDMIHGIMYATEPTTLDIEEVGQAAPAVQAGLAPFCSPDRRVNKWTIPDCVSVVATTNSTHHRAGANPILTHIRSRVASTVHLTPDLESWLEQAAKDNIDGFVTSFLKCFPTMLYELELLPVSTRNERKLSYEKVYSSGEGYTNPRSWYRVDQLVKASIPKALEQEVYTGAVGEAAALLFVSHVENSRMHLDLDAVVNGGKDFKFPAAKELGLRWSFVFGCAALAVRKTVDRIFDIAIELHTMGHTEYAMVLTQQTLARNFAFQSSKGFDRLTRTELGALIREVKYA